jgi:hypothetical protein
MAGMKYSPGFDEPPARPKLLKKRVFAVAVTLIAAGALGATFLAYLSPSLMVDLGSVMLMCAQVLGIR